MRDELLQRIAPLVEGLAEQLVDMLLARVDQHMNQLELAFDAATSAFASDLSVTDGAARRHDVRDATRGNRRATQPRSYARSEARDIEGSASGSLGARVEEHDDAAASDSSSERAADRGVPSYRALQQGKDLPPSTSSGRKPNSCRKCGAVGFTSATCGKTHNVLTSTTANAVETPVSSSTSRTSPASRDSASRAVATTPAVSSTPPPPSALCHRRGRAPARRPRSSQARTRRTSAVLRSTWTKTDARRTCLFRF